MPLGVVIERLHDLRPERVAPLVAESEQAGLGFVRRLAEEFVNGRNRFDRPGEALFAATLAGRTIGVCGRLVGEVIRAARASFENLRVRTNNPAAARLYERMGFRRGDASDCTH